MRTLLILLLFVAAQSYSATVVREFKGDELVKWSGGSVKDKKVGSGGLSVETAQGDSMLISTVFDAVAATASQYIELEMQSDVAGSGGFFWTGTTNIPHGGFAASKLTPFTVATGMHTYRIEPFWQGEKKIIRLRLDFPEQQGGYYLIKALRIVEATPGEAVALPLRDLKLETGTWRGRLNWPASQGGILSLRLTTAIGAKSQCQISFASNATNGIHQMAFPLHADGLAHTYNIDLNDNAAWRGQIIDLRLTADGTKQIELLALGEDPQGPADLEVTSFGLSDAIVRSGKPVQLEALLVNHGGEPARNLKPQLQLKGARLVNSGAVPAQLEFNAPEKISWTVQADQPGTAEATLTLVGAPPISAKLDFRAPLNLPKADYVPVPHPLKTDYLIGAYYYPGWDTAARWSRIQPFPERKPLLGWYREGDPEVADWQIKWAVESGINFFLYDWYWDQGRQHNEQGLDALFKSRYGNMLNFCLLYANHNRPGSHSARDFENMTTFWINNYFKRSNYQKVDGKPVVVMFAPRNPAKDMGVEAVKASFEKMRGMCREAGLKGLYLVACNNDGTDYLPQLKAMGYDAISGYNWPRLNMNPEEVVARRASYEKNIEGYKIAWEKLAAANVLKLIPPVAAGWDDRPWAGSRALERYGRTPELFKRHLIDAKKFLDTRESDPKLKMLFVEAWNELGEGSYIEPHREFGFGYLDAIRQVFAPASPKPLEIVPADVGRGPYDVPVELPAAKWDFTSATNLLGWTGNMTNFRIANRALCFTTRGHDPILNSPSLTLRAAKYSDFVIRLKASRDIDGQLFWVTKTAPVNEAASKHFAIRGDGQFHDIIVRLADHPRWRGLITGLRFDPGSLDGVDVAIESIRLKGTQ